MDAQLDIRGRPAVSLWTYNMTSVDVPSFYMDVHRVAMEVHQLLYGRTTLHKWMSISFSMGALHDIRGRPGVSLWTYSVWPWMSTRYYMDVQHNIHGRSSVSIWTYNVWQWTSSNYYIVVQHYIRGR